MMDNKLENKLNKYYYIVPLAILAFYVLLYMVSRNIQLLVDEPHNYGQIINFVKDGVKAEIVTSQLAGYHATLAIISQVFQNSSIQFVRFVSFGFSVMSIVVFYILTKEVLGGYSKIKTLQYAFLGIILPFYYLIYSDVFSVMTVLAAIYFLLQRRYMPAGIMAAYSVFVRQNNFIWLIFIMLYILFNDYEFRISINAVKDEVKKSFDFSIDTKMSDSIINYLKDCWIFILAGACFMAFVVINKSFVLTDQQAHPNFSFHLGNTYFMLFLFFILFLPLNISNFTAIAELLKTKKIIAVYIFIFCVFSLIFYKIDHIYNVLRPEYYTRNRILLFTASNKLISILYFLVISYSVLSIYVTKLKKEIYYLIYPFSVLYVAPIWLIDQRLYFVPYVLFLLFKDERSDLVEYSTVAINLCLAILIFSLNTHGKHFF